MPLLVEKKIPCTYFVSTGPVLEGVPFEHDRLMGNQFAANTVDELRALSAAGIEIGAHTRTHADLGRVTDRDQLYDELVVARDDLQAAVGQRIRYFAFPFGTHRNLSVAAFEMARAAGYEAVCSAYGGYNFPGDDGFHLQRRGVDGPLIRLKNWSTVDPIRNRRIERYVYKGAAARPALGAV
jgi:peptidoglycan/xylan/chitin deacetylase (PgdA/CDA1 family)